MKKILYLIDDINYKSGAQKVTLFQMKTLQEKYDIYLLSLTQPEEKIGFLNDDHILGDAIWKRTKIFAQSFKNALKDDENSLKEKLLRIIYAISLRIGMGEKIFDSIIEQPFRQIIENFDDIIVVSEASKLRTIVSKLDRPKKIQWIHTDYASWSDFSEWTRAVTREDHNIYPKFDQIVVLSDHCGKGLAKKIPDIEKRISVIPNMVDGDEILCSAAEDCYISIDPCRLNLVTVARLDREKYIAKLFQIAKELKNKSNFKWYIIGDGPDRSRLERLCIENDLTGYVEFLGYLKNPYPIMKRCDALVLLSKYEGTPVTIDEAMVLGIGIVAPKIGGIPEQVEGYERSCLIENDEYLEAILRIQPEERYVYDYKKKNMEIQGLLMEIL